MRLGSLLVFVCAAPLLMAASRPVRLQPSSPWVVDYADNSCRLGRGFGEGKTLTTLRLESVGPDQTDMLVVGNPLDSWKKEVPARFLPVQAKPFTGTMGRDQTANRPAVFWLSVKMMPDDPADDGQSRTQTAPGVRPPALSLEERAKVEAQRDQFAAQATELEIQTDDRHPVILETGSLGGAMKAFRKCQQDSLQDWGVDPAVEAKIVRPVWAPNPASWISSTDYPDDALNRGAGSEIALRLLVDATGKVTKCTSLSHYGEPDFNRVTCDVVTRRAVFAPAELADGTKVPSFYIMRVIYRVAS